MNFDQLSVIGLDGLGGAVAARALAGGHSVSVFDPCGARVARFGSVGARPAAIPADAAEGADVVFVSMPDEASCFDVLLDVGGVGETLRPGGLVLDASATGAAFSAEATRRLALFGITRVPIRLQGGARADWPGCLRLRAECAAGVLAAVGDLLTAVADDITFLNTDTDTDTDADADADADAAETGPDRVPEFARP